MTPKEKAKELCEHYSKLVLYSTNSFDKKLVPEIRTFVKQCALIAVNELIENQNGMQDFLLKEIGYLIPSPTYWQEVKQEIEKL